jgi:thiol-disulfide isomerase/thioredoxin
MIVNSKIKSFFLLLLPLFLLLSQSEPLYSDNKVRLYFFWGKGCPHCAKESKFLKEMSDRYPQLEIIDYEVWYNVENAKLFSRIANAFGMKNIGVPMTLIGNVAVIGFHSPETSGREIENRIKDCIEKGCEDPLKLALKPRAPREPIEERTMSIPGIGKIDPSKYSFPVFTKPCI